MTRHLMHLLGSILAMANSKPDDGISSGGQLGSFDNDSRDKQQNQGDVIGDNNDFGNDQMLQAGSDSGGSIGNVPDGLAIDAKTDDGPELNFGDGSSAGIASALGDPPNAGATLG